MLLLFPFIMLLLLLFPFITLLLLLFPFIMLLLLLLLFPFIMLLFAELFSSSFFNCLQMPPGNTSPMAVPWVRRARTLPPLSWLPLAWLSSSSSFSSSSWLNNFFRMMFELEPPLSFFLSLILWDHTSFLDWSPTFLSTRRSVRWVRSSASVPLKSVCLKVGVPDDRTSFNGGANERGLLKFCWSMFIGLLKLSTGVKLKLLWEKLLVGFCFATSSKMDSSKSMQKSSLRKELPISEVSASSSSRKDCSEAGKKSLELFISGKLSMEADISWPSSFWRRCCWEPKFPTSAMKLFLGLKPVMFSMLLVAIAPVMCLFREHGEKMSLSQPIVMEFERGRWCWRRRRRGLLQTAGGHPSLLKESCLTSDDFDIWEWSLDEAKPPGWSLGLPTGRVVSLSPLPLDFIGSVGRSPPTLPQPWWPRPPLQYRGCMPLTPSSPTSVSWYWYPRLQEVDWKSPNVSSLDCWYLYRSELI